MYILRTHGLLQKQVTVVVHRSILRPNGMYAVYRPFRVEGTRHQGNNFEAIEMYIYSQFFKLVSLSDKMT